MGVHYNCLLHCVSFYKTNSTSQSVQNGMSILETEIRNGLRTMDYDLLTTKANEKFGYWYKIVKGLPEDAITFILGFQTSAFIEKLLEMKQLMIKNSGDEYFHLDVSRIVIKEPTGIVAILFIEDKEINRRALKLF